MGVPGVVVCGRDRAGCLSDVISLQIGLKPYFCRMKRFRQFFLILSLFFTLSVLPGESAAQCPMCKMSAESNLKNGGTAGKGLNTGILYMLALPYTLVGVIGFIWWRNNKRNAVGETEV